MVRNTIVRKYQSLTLTLGVYQEEIFVCVSKTLEVIVMPVVRALTPAEGLYALIFLFCNTNNEIPAPQGV